MNYEIIYLVVSVLVSLMMLVESRILAKTDGKFFGNPVLSAMSLLEFVWLVISGVVLFKLDFPHWVIAVPVVYVFYNLCAWVYGMYLFKQSGLLDKVTEEGDTSELSLPQKYMEFSLSFAIVFLLFSGIALLYMMQPQLFPVAVR